MKPKFLSVLIVVILSLCIIIVSFGIVPVRREVKKDKALADEKISLANRLRQEGLRDASIKEYDEVLNSRSVKDEEKSNICVIVGNMFFEDIKDFQKALEYYTRAKFYGKGKLDKDSTINQRIVEILEKLNRPADAQYELSKQTYIAGPNTVKYPGSVVAKIGDREIKMGELDAMIQKLPQFKRDLIKTPDDKLNYLREYVGRIVMANAAKRKGFDKDKDFIEQLSDIETQLLAGKLYEKEVLDKIKITDLERKYYYESNKDQFGESKKIKIAHIFSTDNKKAKKISEDLKNGGDFDSLVKEQSEDENTKKNNGILGELIPGSTNIPFIGNETEIVAELLKLSEGKISGVLKSQKGYHIFKIVSITPERKRNFEEVKDLVDNKLKTEKENQTREEFITNLMKAEQVFLFEGEFKSDSTETPTSSSETEKKAKENKPETRPQQDNPDLKKAEKSYLKFDNKTPGSEKKFLNYGK